jgi:HD-like signal output (HDOD) protein
MTPAYAPSHEESPAAVDEKSRQALCRVPVFHPVAVKLLGLLAEADVSIAEVSGLLSGDPGFAAEILTMANSAAYGSLRRIYTVERAVVTLGIERTKSLAASAALGGMLRRTARCSGVENCWNHSRATAAIARWLAPARRVHPDRAYTAGLMHDVGRLGLLAVEPEQYSRLLEQFTGNILDLLLAERWAFKIDHCQAGLFLTRTWGLPAEFHESSSEHHGEESPEPALGVVRLACALAHALGYRAAPRMESWPLEELVDQVPGLPPPRDRAAAVLAERLERELAGLANSLAGSSHPLVQ